MIKCNRDIFSTETELVALKEFYSLMMQDLG